MAEHRDINVLWLALAIEQHVLAYGGDFVLHEGSTCTTDCAGDIKARYTREARLDYLRDVAPTSVGKP